MKTPDKSSSQLPLSDFALSQSTIPVTDDFILDALLHVKDSREIEALLNDRFGSKVFSSETYWRPVGDQLSNAGAIEASPEEINPLIERIVNGIEAVIELKIEEKHRGNLGWEIPESPSKAIEDLFGVPEGASDKIDQETARKKFGNYVKLILRGNKETPTVIVKDEGIGIHPSDFHKSILSLGQSCKGQKKYLIGMYGQGGSSAFEKSGYSVILSRKHPSLLRKDEPDLAGWTVVRKRLSIRTHIYEYLVNPITKRVFTIGGAICDDKGFANGTYVAHANYKNLGSFATQRMTNYAWYTLNYRLFNPLIPWTLVDERDSSPELRTMRGVLYRINQLPKSEHSVLLPQQRKGENTSVRHHIKYIYPDPSYGSILVEWWVLQSEELTNGRREHSTKVDPYRDPSKRFAQRRVAVTRAGQVHAALTPNIFIREGLRFVASSIIVNVNTDQLSYEAGASFFASNRADLKRESEEIIEKALGSAIYQYRSELMEIQREREREIIRGRGAKDEEVLKTKLDPMIKAFLSTVSTGSGNVTRRKYDNTPKFKGKAVPTTLEFARNTPLEIIPGIPTHLDLITDASDSVMRSRKTTLKFSQSISPEIVDTTIIGGEDGRWRVRIVPYADITAGTKCALSATLEQSSWRLETKKACQLVVIPPPEEYKGVSPPTFLRFKTRANNEVHIQQGGGRITLESDAEDNLFDYAKFSISKSETLRLLGYSHPSKGQIRLTIETDPDIPIGAAGNITAKLEFNDGSFLYAEANVIITKKQQIEAGGVQYVPNYKIHYVRQVTSSEDDDKWDDMQEILGIDTPWNADDVGGITVTHDDGRSQLHIYLNVDNRETLNVENRLARANSESDIENSRQNHRTLLVYHLYLLGISDENGNFVADLEKGAGNQGQMDYKAYRNEMIRLNRTALYASKEYLDSFKEGQNAA
ncbi:hypothetical protein Dform_00373 [Dehalogenimonas formicexedens]|uniref:Histidine kinase-, DNA gyrase B-, and HSP90-like ATPase n=1 Tax=Dehalogenimonas formicexedens TaxID=1839801 RepID=A0A1P8F5V4_9CHLR|nr:hypothetical protein [Dehalogenimonas formicexedens]APV43732.1 hypothetical protein Dform_00373 [Dehalogenimonas formicexedens]